MKKSFTKRALSLVLCVLMLVSCWVFTAPSADAAVTGPSSTFGDTTPGTSAPSSGRNGQYMVRILIIEGDKLDKTPHDNNKNYTSGLCYGSNDTDSNRNLTSKPGFNTTNGDNGTNKEYWCEYAKISYKSTNGTGSDGAAWFNLGDYNGDGYDNIISGGGYNYGYFPSSNGILIDGFPTEFTTRYVDHTQDGWFGGKTTLSYTAYLQVARWTSNTTYEWTEGTCTNSSGLFSGGWDSQYAGGIASGTCSVQNNNSGVECKITQTVANAKYPVAQSTPTVSYGSTDVTAPSTSSATAVSNALSFTPPKDQYGAYMATSITTSCSNKATGITQSGKTTSVGYTANIAGDTDSQTVTATVKWPQKVTSSQKSKTASFTINDAQYQVTFKNEDGTGNNLYQENFYYGHTPAYNGATPTKTDAENPLEYVYTHDGWSSTANGTKLTSLPAVTGTSNKTFYAHFSSEKAKYTVAFKDADNNVLESRELEYGTVPSSVEGLVPEFISKEADDTNHYVPYWTGGSVDEAIEGNVTFTMAYNSVKHTWENEEGVVTKEANCTEPGTIQYKCSVCEHIVEESIQIDSNKHVWGELQRVDATDNTPGYVYYQCTKCHNKYCTASYVDGQLEPDTSVLVEDPENTNLVNSATGSLPSPIFNDGDSAAGTAWFHNRDYISRPSALRFEKPEVTETQAMRFCANVKVPEGVAMALTSDTDDNYIVDFGFVYTQSDCITDSEGEVDRTLLIYDEDPNLEGYPANKYTPDENSVYRMSIVGEHDKSDYENFKEWTGKTIWTRGEDNYITFNLVINVKVSNWPKEYACRPYITYKYHGVTQTVYDEGASAGITATDSKKYSHNSVNDIAATIMSKTIDDAETPEQLAVFKRDKAYCMDRNLCRYDIMDAWSYWNVEGKPESYDDASPELQKNFLHNYLFYVLAEDL